MLWDVVLTLGFIFTFLRTFLFEVMTFLREIGLKWIMSKVIYKTNLKMFHLTKLSLKV